ncbi:MAG: helix-hairpin-helix domain-containing protein [Deltaproteobacteria bacterium]|nr:helix-hairpin-helix domain-containing protein [Deltaproteobacteria bacterium]
MSRPKTGSPTGPIAVEIRGPEDSSLVSLFDREPSLERVLGRAGFESKEGAVASSFQTVIVHGSVVEWVGGPTKDSVRICPMEARKRLALGLKIDINHAGLDELTAVPGLSRRRAERLIRYRLEYGAIGQLEELTTKRVLGVETVRRIRPFVECVL